jgi:hypothetical protein
MAAREGFQASVLLAFLRLLDPASWLGGAAEEECESAESRRKSRLKPSVLLVLPVVFLALHDHVGEAAEHLFEIVAREPTAVGPPSLTPPAPDAGTRRP